MEGVACEELHGLQTWKILKLLTPPTMVAKRLQYNALVKASLNSCRIGIIMLEFIAANMELSRRFECWYFTDGSLIGTIGKLQSLIVKCCIFEPTIKD
jgi:hypothetical protein